VSDLDRFVPRIWIAYLSMEIAFRPEVPTYSGGLGILAGDAARSSADLELPIVFVTLASREGYLHQDLLPDGTQVELPDRWDPSTVAKPLNAMIAIEIEGRPVWIRPWLHVLESPTGGAVPILLLDTNLTENDPADRDITGPLYGGDNATRLRQEMVLGIGAEAILDALGFEISIFHLNEGHAALLPLTLLRRHPVKPIPGESLAPYDVERVRERCIFTTHTPVEAGHDKFEYDLVRRLLGDFMPEQLLRHLGGNDVLNMTRLALNLSGFVNGVAKRHQETAERMFPGYPIRAITNGVHPDTWVHPALAQLYDTLGPHWSHEPEMLVRIETVPGEQLVAAHAQAKAELLETVRRRTGVTLDPKRPTLVFARRMTSYKRPMLLLEDPERLARIAEALPFQVIFAGKAHPQDKAGKALITRIQASAKDLSGRVPIVFLPDYDFRLAKTLVAGADIWLNTPLPPHEASGTSGMKAALNGVPSLSVLDGWWLEGCVEGLTGWAIGSPDDAPETHGRALLDKLESSVLPLYHSDHGAWARIMAGTISRCGGIFTSHRMMRRYAAEAYLSCAPHPFL